MADLTVPLAGRRVVWINWRDLGHSQAGGSERYAWEACRAFAEAGAQVEFLTARDTHQSASETREGIRIHRGGGQLTFYPRVLARLAWRRLRGALPDLVVDPANGIPTFAPLVLSSSTPVVLVVHHVHQQQFVHYFPGPVARFGQWLEKWLMPRAFAQRTTVVVSPSTDAEMREQLGWSGPTVLVPNGNVLPDLNSGDLPALKGGSHTGATRHVVVFGRMALHKRVDLSVRAFAAVRAAVGDTYGQLRLDVVGSGPQEQEIRELVVELGLQDVARVHGFVADEVKREILLRGWINICASDAEGWGQVVVEAAAHAMPTLARDVPGLRDSVVSGRTGWLVEGNTSAEDHPDRVLAELVRGLRDALEAMAAPATAAEYWDACRAFAGGYTWQAMHEAMVGLAVREIAERPQQVT